MAGRPRPADLSGRAAVGVDRRHEDGPLRRNVVPGAGHSRDRRAAAALHELPGHPPAARTAHPLAAARQLPRPGRHPLLDPRDPGARPRDMVLGQGPVCGDGRRRASGDALRRRRWPGPDRGRPGPERVAVGRLPEPRRAGLRVRPRRDPAHPPRLRLQLRGQRQRHDLPRHRLLSARPADPHQRHVDGRPVRLRARLLRPAVPAQGPQPRLHRRRAPQLRRRRPGVGLARRDPAPRGDHRQHRVDDLRVRPRLPARHPVAPGQHRVGHVPVRAVRERGPGPGLDADRVATGAASTAHRPCSCSCSASRCTGSARRPTPSR